ncbi:D-Ala-D-Ala dipeptidase VanX [Tamaricihabitans halophyticus]|uniref:D-alanyl-D-alanine dipeptidase n=1 Tax=Tamaricihabitans halophyticus TaxID=1262583 RepID=A0A4V2SU47_9PSEU|nr:M15 family metallopeptidase [Tamaricihabitans halophyticus]TCP53196.1 D-Ala-D-Ala dipeptidase VanX [Tamaricihabitans halophyticus]
MQIATQFRGRLCAALLAALTAVTLVAGPSAAAANDPTSAARWQAPDEFVALADVAPTIKQEIRYNGWHNFVGRPVTGYLEPMCVLTRPTAQALRGAQQEFLAMGYSLKIYDCFRPQRAVDDFVRWAQRPQDERMKAEFYPRIEKSTLFDDGYIAEESGHSRGSTVDLTLVPLPAKPQRPYLPGEPLAPCYAPADERFPDNSVDMGTGFDCFDTLSHTDDSRITETQRANRELLVETLESYGLENYDKEWWHFTLTDEPFPDTYFDFPVTRLALTN